MYISQISDLNKYTPKSTYFLGKGRKKKSHYYAAVLSTENKLFWTAPNQTLLKTLPTSTNRSDIIKIFGLQQLNLDTENKG